MEPVVPREPARGGYRPERRGTWAVAVYVCMAVVACRCMAAVVQMRKREPRWLMVGGTYPGNSGRFARVDWTGLDWTGLQVWWRQLMRGEVVMLWSYSTV